MVGEGKKVVRKRRKRKMGREENMVRKVVVGVESAVVSMDCGLD